MSKFTRGQTVIALSDSPNEGSQKRKKGCIYTVQFVRVCSKCDTESINIGEESSSNFLKCLCGCRTSTRGKGWTLIKHFANAVNIYQEMIDAGEAEDYDTAILLRDIINTENSLSQ